MPSQLELLKKQLVISEARSGPDNPFVKGLKQQIASLERKQPQQSKVEHFSGGMRGPPVKQPPRDSFLVAEVSRDGLEALVMTEDFMAARDSSGVWRTNGPPLYPNEDWINADSALALKLLSEARASVSSMPDLAKAD